MVEISCFYIHYNCIPINFTFIKYEKFIKIILQKRDIIIRFENLKNHQLLFNFYILSLLCTKNTSKIDYIPDFYGNIVYGISTEKIWKYLYFNGRYGLITLEKNKCSSL